MPPELILRTLEPADADAVQEFVRSLSAWTRTQRYFAPIRELNARQLERVTRQGDPRDLALGAFAGERLVALAECAGGEFGLVVDDGWQSLGLGEALLERLLAHAEASRLPALHAVVRERNRPMLRLARRLGFRAAPAEDPGFMRIEFGV